MWFSYVLWPLKWKDTSSISELNVAVCVCNASSEWMMWYSKSHTWENNRMSITSACRYLTLQWSQIPVPDQLQSNRTNWNAKKISSKKFKFPQPFLLICIIDQFEGKSKPKTIPIRLVSFELVCPNELMCAEVEDEAEGLRIFPLMHDQFLLLILVGLF